MWKCHKISRDETGSQFEWQSGAWREDWSRTSYRTKKMNPFFRWWACNALERVGEGEEGFVGLGVLCAAVHLYCWCYQSVVVAVCCCCCSCFAWLRLISSQRGVSIGLLTLPTVAWLSWRFQYAILHATLNKFNKDINQKWGRVKGSPTAGDNVRLLCSFDQSFTTY